MVNGGPRLDEPDVRRLDDGSWHASHAVIPAHGYGATPEEAIVDWWYSRERLRHGEEVLAGEPT